MERRQYRKPPIEEALCELRFEPGPEWDLTIPGKLQKEIEADYPGKPRQQNVFEANVQRNGRGTALSMREGIGRVQLPTADGTRLVGVGPDVLSIHVLRPYEQDRWEGFRERIEKAFVAYAKVAQPTAVRRIGIRYVNNVTVPKPNANPAEYFRCVSPRVDALPKSVSSFFTRTEYGYEDGSKLILTFASTESPSAASSSFLLDLDVVWECSNNPKALSDILSAVDDLRARERTAFEALITDEARRNFDAP